MQLRDYQQRDANRLRAAFAQGARAVVYVLGTGGGKTYTFSHIAQNAVAKGNNVLILAHRRELIRQTSQSLRDIGVSHGVIAPRVPRMTQPIQVASVHTLVRRMDRYNWRPGLIIVDEAHHLVDGSTWGKIIEYYEGTPILGVTATPTRLDGRGLGREADGVFDTMVVGPSIRELIDQGYLAPPVVYAPPTAVDLSGVRTRGGDFAAGALADAMDKPTITGDAVRHYQKLCTGEPAIAFCASINHAEHVAERFRAAGYQAASIDGNMDGKEREQRIRDLGNGQLHVLTSCDIVSEGTDIPVVSAAILLRPTQSESLFLQQVGRSLRVHPGKTRALILDHVGNVMRHGMPDEDREWSLAGRPRGRGGDKSDAAPIRQCEQCYTVHRPAPRCPSCGHLYPVQEREVEEVDGELQEVDPEVVRRMRKQEQAKAKTKDELTELANQRGYKNPRKWAEYVYNARQKKRRAA